jgi:cytoskeletal protein CcmA (bactofilin family)
VAKKGIEDYGGNLNTIIGKGSAFEGRLSVQSTLRVDGRVKGTIKTSDSLVVGKEGDIDGDVAVRNAILGGKLKGKLDASGKVVLESNSVFSGELKTTKLVIDEGAVFEGTCAMGTEHSGDKQNSGKNSGTMVQKGDGKELKVVK